MKTTRASAPAQYYFFVVLQAVSAVVFGLLAKTTYDAQLAVDRLPEHDIDLIPWYLPAIVSLGCVVVLIWTLQAKRLV